jgi:hypothetical protein
MNDLNPLVDLCRQLQRVQTQAKAHGIFVGDRELIDCPSCGLFEDVTAEGQLITSRELATLPLDTGLRFSQVSLNNYQCPACAGIITLKDDAHGEED